MTIGSEQPRTFSGLLEYDLVSWSQRTCIEVEIWALPSQDLTGPAADRARETVRAALAEVERFGRAKTVSFALTMHRGGLRLTVADEGAVKPEEEVRGRRTTTGLTISRIPGGGTTIGAVIRVS
ncbi:hypothetical protein [Nonomuraea soli]|uniref:Signal transduction histidine kinase n=1 Tax=Nonomuraea soli TaxID=1032476 RepID=A0A7W0CD77_9ACTN|nr:hypothetical protein [Nonomuraea soli]MBA2888857.1 signal transduction histidine kinase [Nonomuraea soli]